MRRAALLGFGVACARGFTAPPGPRAAALGTMAGGRSRMGSAPTPTETEAAASFKMITEEEATVRKVAGVGIGVATTALYAIGGLGYGGLSAGAFGAISTFRTGAEYQWGCIANGKWNVNGPLTMTDVPESLAAFVPKKQKQLRDNILTSAAAGVVAANGLALLSGDASLGVLAQTIQVQVPLMVLTAVASALAR